MAKPKRTRTARREADRGVEKLSVAARKLYLLSAGGGAAHPLTLTSPSQVEVDAEGTPCPACGMRMRITGPHEVVVHEGQRLRVARLQCTNCRQKWDRFYRVGPVLH